MSSKFAIENENMLQLLGDFVPQTPYRGSAPGPRWGTSVPQTPSLVQFKIFLKKALLGKLFTPMCLSPSSIIGHRPRGGDALRLGR